MFPMRSNPSRRRILLIGASTALAVTGCSSEAAKDADHANGSQSSGVNSADGGSQRARAEAAGRPDIPVTDALHFDLHCATHGHVVSDSRRWGPTGSYPANEPRWTNFSRFVIDLQTMRYCDAVTSCLHYRPGPIARVTADRIILDEAPTGSAFIRRTDWRLEVRRDDGGLVSVDSGRCTKAPFSGFPSVPLPEEPT
jgi:hypothetical protein